MRRETVGRDIDDNSHTTLETVFTLLKFFPRMSRILCSEFAHSTGTDIAEQRNTPERRHWFMLLLPPRPHLTLTTHPTKSRIAEPSSNMTINLDEKVVDKEQGQ